MKVINLLTLLADNPEATFHAFHNFNGMPFGAVDITGESPVWEMHPGTDEFFYVIDGEMEIDLYEEDGISHHVAPMGSTFVVPTGMWHKISALKGVKILYFTPGESLHSDAEDPRDFDASIP